MKESIQLTYSFCFFVCLLDRGHITSFSQAVFVPMSAIAAVGSLRREELIHRETHFLEDIAGAFGVGTAFLGGHAEIVDGHEHLHITDQLDDGENAQCHQHDLAVVGIAEAAAEVLANAGGDAGTAAIALAGAFAFFNQACVQYYRFRDLYRTAGHIAGRHFLAVVVAGTEFTGKYLDAAFTAEQDYLFLEHGNAANGVATGSVSGIYLQLDLKIEGEIAGIIAAVERESLHIDKGGDDLSLFSTDADSVINDHLIPFGEIYPQIFQAILVTARIVHATGIDTHGFFTSIVMDVFVGISHKNPPMFMMGVTAQTAEPLIAII